MPRSVPEWVASHPDQAIPASVKLRVWNRCDGKCALTGRRLRVGDAYDFDHIRPLSMGGQHAETNLQLVGKEAHKEKSSAETTVRAKADRTRAKHLGVWPKGQKIRGRNSFQKRYQGET